LTEQQADEVEKRLGEIIQTLESIVYTANLYEMARLGGEYQLAITVIRKSRKKAVQLLKFFQRYRKM